MWIPVGINRADNSIGLGHAPLLHHLETHLRLLPVRSLVRALENLPPTRLAQNPEIEVTTIGHQLPRNPQHAGSVIPRSPTSDILITVLIRRMICHREGVSAVTTRLHINPDHTTTMATQDRPNVHLNTTILQMRHTLLAEAGQGIATLHKGRPQSFEAIEQD